MHSPKIDSLKINKIIIFLIVSIFICSCSKEDINKEFGSLKKIEGIFEGTIWRTMEIEYTQSNQIQKLTIDAASYNKVIYSLQYENDVAIKLNLDINYYIENHPNESIDYDITYNNNEITLSPRESTNHKNIVIKNTNGFVDYYKVFYGDNSEYFLEEIYIRNSENNIESVSLYDTNQSGSNIFAWRDTFLNFEQNVNLNPIYNPVFDLLDINLITALSLKISNKNPTKLNRLVENQVIVEDLRLIGIEYDNNGFVEKCTMEYNTNSYEYYYSYY